MKRITQMKGNYNNQMKKELTNQEKLVGTLTFHNVNNYGAVLQAYALQKSIEKMGYNTELINYSRDNIADVICWVKCKVVSLLKGKPDHQLYTVSEFLKMVFFGEGNTRDINESFVNFRRKYLKMSEPITRKNVKTIRDKYDLVITGSDQIWNCGRVNIEPTYMLDFIEDSEKKASYAASFGISTLPDKYVDIYKKLLADYKYLAVREEQGAKIIEELLQRKAEVVVDPTLLLGAEEWNEIAVPPKSEKPYILVYQLEYSERLMQFARNLSKKLNMPLRFIRRPLNAEIEEECCSALGPDEWVGQFGNASYVVTNSFHGTAFSIIFRKTFFVEIAQERIRAAMSSRLEHLLNRLSLNKQFITSEEVAEEILAIDYTDTEIILNEWRENSVKYLRTVLENIK